MTKNKADAIVQAAGVDVAELASFKSQAVQLVDFLTHSPCKTSKQEEYFSARLSDVRALLKTLEDNRKALKGPLLEAGRRIDALFSPSTKPLKECEEIIRAKLAGAAMGRKEAEQAALALAAEAATSGDSQGVMTALAAVPDVVQTVGSSVKYVWVPDKVDVEVLSRSYMTVDMAKLEGVGRAAGDKEPTVVGVTWKQVAKVRAKG